MKDRQAFPWCTLLGIPEDRSRLRTTLPLAPLSEYQRTDYKYEGQPFPWHPSRSTRGQTTSTTDKPSPGAPLGVPEDRLHEGQTSLPLVYPSRNARGQTTCRTDEAFPWCTLLGMPEDRLHVGQTKPSPGVPFSECQRTDYTCRTDEALDPLVYPSRNARGQTNIIIGQTKPSLAPAPFDNSKECTSFGVHTKMSLQRCLGCWDSFRIERAFSVGFKHRNWFPSIPHMTMKRSVLSFCKAGQCSKNVLHSLRSRVYTASVGEVLQYTRNDLSPPPMGGTPFSGQPLATLLQSAGIGPVT